MGWLPLSIAPSAPGIGDFGHTGSGTGACGGAAKPEVAPGEGAGKFRPRPGEGLGNFHHPILLSRRVSIIYAYKYFYVF